jgi:hypothetical protein
MLNKKLIMSTKLKTTTFIATHTELTPVIGRPNHVSIMKLRQQLFANAMANPCLRGLTLGYLGIIMPDDEYNAKQVSKGHPPVPFTIPTLPELAINDDDTEVSHTEDQLAQYNQDTADYIVIETALKNQLIAAINELYITELVADDVGYGDYSAKQILAYIVKKYDKIQYKDIQNNREKLDAKWDITDPIQTLWQRIDECKRFAKAGGYDLDDMTIMQATFTVLQNTGVFELYCILWKRQPEDTWTLAEFKIFFEEANEERSSATAKEVGYHGAHKATAPTTTTKNTGNTTTTQVSTEGHDARVCIINGKKIWFCWSHGGSTNAGHTSATCTKQKDGHVVNSDWGNTCGGCTEMLWSEANRKTKAKKYTNNNNNNSANNTTGTTTATYSQVVAANTTTSN